MSKTSTEYYVVDAFTDSAWKGNPAAVCFLESDRDVEWLLAVAREFNVSATCYLTPITGTGSNSDRHDSTTIPRFRLRWFCPAFEVDLCGHATLGASYVLFTYGSIKSNVIEYDTLSGILTAKRIPQNENSDDFLIELDFPVVPVVAYDSPELSAISKCLGGASIMEVHKTTKDDLIVVLLSGEIVKEYQPQVDDIRKCPGRGIIITGTAPLGSDFDFYSRVFFPKYGVPEDSVCGSAHCALAAYWSKKLRKSDFTGYAASPRGGIVHLSIDEKNNRVSIRGKAVAVMKGCILV